MRGMFSALATYSFSVGYILNHFQCEVYKRGAYLFVQKKKRDLDHGELLSLYKTFLRNLALFGIPPRPPSPSPAFNHRFIYKLFSFLKNKTQTAVINIVSFRILTNLTFRIYAIQGKFSKVILCGR